MRAWELKPAYDHGLPQHERSLSLRRESGLVSTLAQRCWLGLTRGYLGLCHDLTVTGRESLPQRPPFVVVSNHCSHLDAPVLAAALSPRFHDQVFPLAAGDMFFASRAKALFSATVLNALPIWRHQCCRHAIQALRKRLADEECIYILFPEGTRSRTGHMAAFKSGLGMLLTGTDVPLVPCRLEGAFEALPAIRIMPRLRGIHLHIGEPVTFADIPNSRVGWERATRECERAVRRLAQSQ